MTEAMIIVKFMVAFIYTVALVAITLFTALLVLVVLATAGFKSVRPGAGRASDDK